jgi:PEP-CTERM/exosortase A-associated glycosyltransferase
LLRAIGSWAISGSAPATAEAERIGSDPRTDPRTAAVLARFCFEIGSADVAERILDRLPPASGDADRLLLSAEIDARLGRYRAAVESGRAVLAIRPADRDALRIVEWASGELVVLGPAWRPALRAPRSSYKPVERRILHLLTNSLPYRQAGYTVRAQNIARCQIDAGLDPRMATRVGFPGNEGVHGAPATSTVDGVHYHRLLPDLDPRLPADRLATRYVEAAADLIDSLRPAVLHPASYHVNAQVALGLREVYRVPVVYEVRGFLEETWLSRVDGVTPDSDRYIASREAETACMRDADAVVTLSETMRQDIIGRGIEPDRVVVVPNAVDVERFRPGPHDPALAARLGIGTEPVVGYVSSFTGYEGIRYLIEAVAELRRRGRRLRCLLVGDGEERAALEAAVRSAGLDDGTVVFTGRVPHDRVLDYYRLIDVFVVPRTNDRVSRLVTPLKPYEAMAMERVVVVSAVGPLLEIVADGETGRSFVPEDPVSLADTVEPLLADPAERARIGRAARRWVAENRTWRRNGELYRALYARLGVR